MHHATHMYTVSEVALQDLEHHVEFVLAVDDGLVAKVGQQDWDLVRARPASASA